MARLLLDFDSSRERMEEHVDAHHGQATSEPETPVVKEAAESISITLTFGKSSENVSVSPSMSLLDLKQSIFDRLGIQLTTMKLLLAGKALKADEATLSELGVKGNSKILIMGTMASSSSSIPPSTSSASSSSNQNEADWDSSKQAEEEPPTKKKEHLKWIEKGVPEDAIPGIAGKQVPLAEGVVNINGLLNSSGSKIRLTFKEEMQQLWIGSATSTQKVPYSTISKIESWPIEGKSEYSIVALSLGSGSSSKYWIYFFPSQHTASLKIRILGVASLL